jgi:hypothetical protein
VIPNAVIAVLVSVIVLLAYAGDLVLLFFLR